MHTRTRLALMMMTLTLASGCGDDGAGRDELDAADCSDGVDNDGDEQTDCDDPGCAAHDFCSARDAGIDSGPPRDGGPAAGTELTAAECSDGEDNDADGAADCDDVGCRGFPFCSEVADAGPPGMDAGAPDAGRAGTDAGPARDAGHRDAGGRDAGRPDAGRRDSGTPDAGAPDAGDTDAGPEICGGAPIEGWCVTPSLVEYCLVPTGAGEPAPVTYACPEGSVCDDTTDFAFCRLTGACRDGDRQCLGDDVTLRTCVDGSWVSSACPRDCVASLIGDFCRIDISTRRFSGRFEYEARSPNAALTDWGDSFEAPAQGFLVLSYRGEELIDAVRTTVGTSTGGEYSIRVPAVTGPDDTLLVVAAGVAASGDLGYVVADPGYAPSATPRDVLAEPPDPRIWFWQAALEGLVDGETLYITEPAGSGAARVFDYLRYVYNLVDTYYRPTVPHTIIVWLGLDTTWSCGACQMRAPTVAFDLDFQSRIWIAGGSDEGYWSDPVTTHELGHYVMSAFGRGPSEGGPHSVGVPTHPGQAWSEGWATYFSSHARDSSVYYDKQRDAMFWVDIDRRLRDDGGPWTRPSAAAGLTQLMDENEVAAMLWELRNVIGGDAIYDALSSVRMTEPPFARGYTRRYWTTDIFPAYYDTLESAPFVADMFDALRCSGSASAGEVDAVTDPLTSYPYPSASPECGRPESPVTVAWRTQGPPVAGRPLRLRAVIERRAALSMPLSWSIELPAGTRLLMGSQTGALSPAPGPAHDELDFIVEVGAIPTEDIVLTVHADGPAFGYHAEVPYRFGRAPPTRTPLPLANRILRVGRRAFGRPVVVR